MSEQLLFEYFSVGGGDQGYGSGRYDSRPGGYGYGMGSLETTVAARMGVTATQE